MKKSLAVHLGEVSRGRLVLAMAAWFAVTHALFFLIGLDPRFTGDIRASGLSWGWQFIDIPLLQGRLAESLFYLHTQPPLYNLYLGLVLKAFPGYEFAAMRLLSMFAGFAFYLSVYYIMRNLNVGRPISLVLSSLFIATPSFILLENASVGYDFPVAVLVSIAFVFLFLLLKKPGVWWGTLLFLTLFVICATRSLFHIVFFLIFIAAIIISRTVPLGMVLRSAAIPFLLLAAIYVKNYALYGKFTTSTWMGMNAAKVLFRSSSPDQRREWYDHGIVSETMLIEPWSDLEDYPDALRGNMKYPTVPLLHEAKKSNGYKNLHHIDYITIADQYQRDALQVYRFRPRAALFGQLSSWYCYFRSTAESIFLQRDQLGFVPDVFDYAFYGKSPWPIPFQKGYNLYIFLLIGLPLLFLYGIWVSLGKAPRIIAFGPQERVVVALVCFTILYVAVVINLFELAENQRARFYTDPLSLALLGVFIQDLRRRITPRNS